MNCHAARILMLTAEAGELSGSGDTELARHVRACVECRSRADQLLAAQHELGIALGVTAHAKPVPRQVIAAAERRRAVARRARRLAPLAAAAALAGLLWVRHTPPPPAAIPSAQIPARHEIAVTAPPGRSVAVLQGGSETNGIVVIWFF